MLKSVDHYQADLESSRQELEKLSYDEFGAKREHIMHRDLGELISKNISFNSDGTASLNNDRDFHIVGVTALDMRIANAEIGQHGGDAYLKETVSRTQRLFEGKNSRFDMYHKNGQDFTCIIESNQADAILNLAQEEDLEIGGKTLRNSFSIVKLSDVVKLYNNFSNTFEIAGNYTEKEKKQQRIFAELLLGYSDYAREFKKLYEVGDEYLLKQDDGFDEQDEIKFGKYSAYMFAGTKFEKLDGFKDTGGKEHIEVRKEFLEECKNIAERKIFGEKASFADYMKVVLDKYTSDLSHKHKVEGVNAFDPSAEKEPMSSYQEFVQKYTTPKQQEYIDTKAGITDIRSDINSTLKTINFNLEQFETINATKRQELVDYFCITLDEIKVSLNSLQQYAGEDAKEISEDIEKLGLDDKEKVAEIFSSKNKTMDLFENVLKFKLAADIAETRFNIELCTFDQLTGLRNKETFEKDLTEQEAAGNKDLQVITIDLSYLTYYNEKGNREMGNTAIRGAGYVLEECGKEFESLKAYRIGGDEFGILFNGSEAEVKKIIEFISNKTAEMGSIPKSGYEHGTYYPHAIQFNMGYCTQPEAEKALEYMLSLGSIENPTPLIESSPEYDPVLRAKMLGKVQGILASVSIESQKIENRVMYLKGLIDSGDLDKFNNLFPFSGRAMKGIDPISFEQIIRENPDLAVDELVKKVLSVKGDFGLLAKGREEILKKTAVEFARNSILI